MSFQQEVLKLTKKIPKGKVTTYKMIAQRLDTKAYQAVGNALHSNKQPIKIPYHRVINSDLSLGGYSSGIEKKIILLRKEGIKIKDGKVAKEFIFSFS